MVRLAQGRVWGRKYGETQRFYSQLGKCRLVRSEILTSCEIHTQGLSGAVLCNYNPLKFWHSRGLQDIYY
jgi:hypothetical protein